ncbi:PAS domain S-box protein [Flavobacterium circumlabens]|uniref:histidine kinase n=1 Tax=Flavobacterium circumlabens TaxID=2133765 RepID=A0A4Y7UAU3_9FLAO|nr:PAS domain-containing protein [Flavobacterium circumlabens]TCN56551.1 PAS domain S-box-containing protein [Flavobacterium circumlabens]TEB43567.1 PAS domain S-box protein [Flavobacterium circumlabens]
MSNANLDFLSPHSEIAKLIRDKDWSNNPIGKADLWPPVLKSALIIISNSKLPTVLFWGNELVVFYNDTFLEILDSNEKEKFSFGEPFKNNSDKEWEFIEPILKNILLQGNTVFYENQIFEVFLAGKNNIPYTVSCNPISDELGKTAGITVSFITTSGNEKNKLAKNIERYSATQSVREFRKIVAESSIPIAILRGPNHIIENVNSAMFQTVFQKESKGIFGKTLIEVFPNMRDQKYPDLLDEVFKSGLIKKEKEAEIYVLYEGERYKFYFDFEFTPLLQADGNTSGIMVIIYDVTEKVEARKKAEDAEERATLAAEIAEIATWDLNLQTHQLIHSASLATTFGYLPSVKMSYIQMLEHIDPADLTDIVNKAFEEAMNTGYYKYVVRINKADGEARWIKSHGKIFMDDTGEPLKMIGTILDITNEREREDLLLGREQKFRMLADSVPQLIWTADSQGNFNYFNLSVYKYTGLAESEMSQGGLLSLIHKEDRDQFMKLWSAAIGAGTDLSIEHRLLNVKGQYRWHLSHASAQKDILGNIQIWVGTSHDIQNQKTFTNELEKQVHERTTELMTKNGDLVKMNIELRSFAYVSSHDLQEPLRKIQMFISRLEDTEEDAFTENAKEYFTRIKVAASRMQTLIVDLLDYSRTNTLDKIFVNTNLEDLVKEVINDYKEIIEEKNAVIEFFDLSEVRGIPFQLRQLFSNLIGNSLKFTRKGISPHIIIKRVNIKEKEINAQSENPERNYCHICFSDNGIGFETEYETRIFEIFRRLHDNVEFKGTGIGLAIVKKIVENHEGIITAKGTKGKGAQFNIYIPIL